MKGKNITAAAATCLFLFILWLIAAGLGCGKSEAGDIRPILKFKKDGIVTAVYLPLVKPMDSISAEGHPNEPLLIGLLMLFIAVSAASVGFACHLLRNNGPAT